MEPLWAWAEGKLAERSIIRPMATVVQFQPSEIAKLGVIVYFAESISKKREKMRSFREGFLPHSRSPPKGSFHTAMREAL